AGDRRAGEAGYGQRLRSFGTGCDRVACLWLLFGDDYGYRLGACGRLSERVRYNRSDHLYRELLGYRAAVPDGDLRRQAIGYVRDSRGPSDVQCDGDWS